MTRSQIRGFLLGCWAGTAPVFPLVLVMTVSTVLMVVFARSWLHTPWVNQGQTLAFFAFYLVLVYERCTDWARATPETYKAFACGVWVVNAASGVVVFVFPSVWRSMFYTVYILSAMPVLTGILVLAYRAVQARTSGVE